MHRGCAGSLSKGDSVSEVDNMHSKTRYVSRRSLVVSAAALGICGIAAAVVGTHCTTDVQDGRTRTQENETDLPKDETDLPEESLLRPGRAVAQGELVTITNGNGSLDVAGVADFIGTIRVRITGSWLYDSAEAFERAEGISVADNWADLNGLEEGRAYYEGNPNDVETELKRLQERVLTYHYIDRVDDLLQEYNNLLTMNYTDDWSVSAYFISTQMLLDAGYKLLSYDFEFENVDAHVDTVLAGDVDDETTPLFEIPKLARGSDVAVWSTRFYLVDGEREPSAKTYEEGSYGAQGSWLCVPVTQGETRRIHVVMAVSPLSLKGELSLFMGDPVLSATVPDGAVMLALNPETVS